MSNAFAEVPLPAEPAAVLKTLRERLYLRYQPSLT